MDCSHCAASEGKYAQHDNGKNQHTREKIWPKVVCISVHTAAVQHPYALVLDGESVHGDDDGTNDERNAGVPCAFVTILLVHDEQQFREGDQEQEGANPLNKGSFVGKMAFRLSIAS